MKARHRRFALDRAPASPRSASPSALVLNAFQSNLVFFFTPTQVAAKEAPQGRAVPHRRPGRGAASQRDTTRSTCAFVVTDTAQTIPVVYTGILPDLFKEGKGVVAQGRSAPTACSARPKCWPSTTRTTCRRKPPAAMEQAQQAHGDAAALHESKAPR